MERVSPSVLLVPAQFKSRRLAAKACWAAWVRMADQRERREASTALRRMWGTALAFVWAKRRRKVVASGLHRPPVSMARTSSLHLLERRSSGYVRSLALRASWSAAPAYWPARLRGWLEEVKGDTRVVSTASQSVRKIYACQRIWRHSVWKTCACQRISRPSVWTRCACQRISRHSVWKHCACQRIWRHTVWKSCACQRISCPSVPVSAFRVTVLENAVPVSAFGVTVFGDAVPVSAFGVTVFLQCLETLCLPAHFASQCLRTLYLPAHVASQCLDRTIKQKRWSHIRLVCDMHGSSVEFRILCWNFILGAVDPSGCGAERRRTREMRATSLRC